MMLLEGKTSGFLGSFLTQVQILSGLTHPCIVKLVGVGVGPTSPILLTEFLENRDVESLRLKPGFAFMVIVGRFWLLALLFQAF